MNIAAKMNGNPAPLKCSMSESGTRIDATLGSVQKVFDGEIEHYAGEYTVEPDVVSQTLKTNKKMMDDDLKVLAIPLHEVSNQSGTTFIIGGVDIYEL